MSSAPVSAQPRRFPRRGRMYGLLRAGAFAAAGVTGLAAQKGPAAGFADPYAPGPAAAEPTGFLSHGPFPLAADHGSREVQEELGLPDMLWLETAHFRL